jgi:hypothetical protein
MRRNTLRTFGLGAAALATLLVLPACSGNPDEAAVRTAVTDYLDEVGEANYTAACGFLHAEAKAKLGADCAAALQQKYAQLPSDVREDFDEINVDDVTIKGSTATVAAEDVRVEIKSKSKSYRKGKIKSKTKTSYVTAPDVTNGAGFTLKKDGKNWKIAAGV